MYNVLLASNKYVSNLSLKNKRKFFADANIYAADVTPNKYGIDEIEYTKKVYNTKNAKTIILYDDSVMEKVKHIKYDNASTLGQAGSWFKYAKDQVADSTAKIFTSPAANIVLAAAIGTMSAASLNQHKDNLNSNATNGFTPLQEGGVQAGYAVSYGFLAALTLHLIGKSLLSTQNKGDIIELNEEDAEKLLKHIENEFKLKGSSLSITKMVAGNSADSRTSLTDESVNRENQSATLEEIELAV